MTNIPVRHILDSTQKEPLFQGNFSIRDIQQFLNGKNMVEELHRHDFFLILILEKGSGLHEVDLTPYPVKDKTVFFIRPGQVHKLTLKANSKGYLLQFDSEFYYPEDEPSRQNLRRASDSNHYKIEKNQFFKILLIAKQIHDEYNNQGEGFLGVIKANLVIFFTELIRNRNSLKKVDNNNNNNSYAQERLEEFLYLLEKNIKDYKNVSDYAEMLSLSSYQLNAITKANLNKTCSELITDQIILESKRYLLATSNQVKEIAYHLGYDDVSYFTRVFRKQTGFSPEAFRKKFK